MPTSLQTLAEHGQSPWVDYVSRSFVRDGPLGELIGAGVRGLTSNPTILQSAIADGTAYDDQLHELLREQDDLKEIFLALVVEDLRGACDLLRPVFDENPGSQHGWVSLEVDPRLANDTSATAEEAIRLHRLVDRPNLMVKIPGTVAGLPAIEETVANGIPVNVTLLFSLERHRQAALAYQRGLRRLLVAGGDLRTVASVASFFVSRVDTEADRLLTEAGGPEDLRGTLAVANARLAYQTYQNVFSGPEWAELTAAGASPQWCLWASTSMKDERRPDVFYVEQLIGPDTVTTLPRQTAEAFLDHGTVADTLTQDLDDARTTLTRFEAAGVQYADVVQALEVQGVQRFGDSFQQLLNGIADKRDQLLRTS
ncbi:MAG TPA: transaldolase [Pseudonocardiaceae bacterium]|nr:transaldolase [Pseudonocardiaceae bacterium]